MADAPQPKRRLLTRWEIFFLVVAVLLVLSFLLKQCGVNMVEVTDDTEIIEHPHR